MADGRANSLEGSDGELESVAQRPIDDFGSNGREATETTRLLGAGTTTDTNGSNGIDITRKDSWAGFDDFEGLPWWRTPSVFWLLAPYLLFTLAFGGIIVPKLNLILDLVCRHYFADRMLHDPTHTFTPIILGDDNPQCLIPEVQKRVSLFMLVLNLVAGILSAITAPRIGRLSDRYGRTRLMAIASCGGFLGEGIMILAARFPDVVSYNWLILGAMFDGLCGSFTAGSVLTQSYTSDCTPPSKRAVKMGYIHACLFSGLAFGPLVAGIFVKYTGNLLSIFYVAMGCHAFFILCVLFVIPESISKKTQMFAREKFAQKREAEVSTSSSWLSTLRTTNPFEPLKILLPRGPGSSPKLRRNMIILAAIDMAMLGTAMGSMTVVMLYSEYTFGWETPETSQFISAISLVRVFILMGIFPIINYFVRTRPAARRRRETGIATVEKNEGVDQLDIWIIRMTLLADALGVTGYIFARTGTLFFISGLVTALGGLGGATLQASITKHVPPDRVGELLGAIGLLHALNRVLSPVLFNGLYAGTVDSFPQAIFVLLSAIFLSAVIASIGVRPHLYLKETEEDSSDLLVQRPILGTEILSGEEIVNAT